MAELPKAPVKSPKAKESWADIDEFERKSNKSSINDKKLRIQTLINDIFDEEDKIFAKACLDKVNRLVISELNMAQVNNNNQTALVTKLNPDNYKLNFHCTTYHWISDCRPKSRIQIKADTFHIFHFKLVNNKPYLGVGEANTEWFELSLNDIIIEFTDDFGADTKLKVKLIKVASPVTLT